MKKRFSKTAFTLIELIVALALVSVILLGVFSISMVLSNNSQDYGQRYLVKSETETTLNHILNDASLAIGSTGQVGIPPVADGGVVIWPSGLNENFCFHEQGQVAYGGSNPPNDFWACYEWDNTTTDGQYKEICNCTYAYSNNPSTNNRGVSNANCCGVGNSFLGTAMGVPLPTWTNNINQNGQMSFSININNCLIDRTSPTGVQPFTQAANCGTVNNPQVTVYGSVTPQQEGMNQT